MFQDVCFVPVLKMFIKSVLGLHLNYCKVELKKVCQMYRECLGKYYFCSSKSHFRILIILNFNFTETCPKAKARFSLAKVS